jgi:hypothetical protein
MAAVTPSTSRQTLAEHYERLLKGQAQVELGDHAVF